MESLYKIFVLLISFSNFSFAQGEGALPTTLFQQSPLLLGAGQVGVSVPNDEVLGFYYNPAILGYSARNNHASFSFMPTKTEWFFSPDLTFNNYGFNFGYNLKKSQLDLPITIGIGYLHNKFDYGEPILRNFEHPDGVGTIESYSAFNSFSLGVGIDYYLRFNFGISLKPFDSKMGGRIINEKPVAHSVEGTMIDYGALIILPISELWMNSLKYDIDESTSISPITNLSFGYSLSNVGDEIYYVNPAQSDPLSRTARLGYTFEFGTDLLWESAKINLFKYSFTAEANDILVNRRITDDGNIVENYKMYQGALGDISFSEHIINLKSDDNVILHKGHIFRFFETVILTSGSFRGKGYSHPRQTDGLGFTSKGLFNLLNAQIKESALKYILNHFVIRYFKSDVEFIKNRKTTFDNLSIHFTGFEI